MGCPRRALGVAERALALHEEGEVSFIAPDSLVAEFGHSLRSFVLSRQLLREDAATGMDELLDMRIELVSSSALAPKALELALAQMGTFYDALYISLAEREDLKVLTADDRMASAFAKLDRVVRLADFPAG